MCAFCQTDTQEEKRMAWEDFVTVMMEEMDEEDGLDEVMLERLEELYGNPMDINEAGKEDLEMLPFLSQEQVEGILRYRERNGRMESLGELMMVEGLGLKEREMLKAFVEVRRSRYDHDMQDLTVGKMLKYGRNEVVWRTDVPFYTKEGYQLTDEKGVRKTGNKVYRGDRFHHSFRYGFSGMRHLLAGVQVEKDAGESGVDYVSGYVMLKDVGCVKRAVLGNYRVSFGKGLVMNSGMKFGKMMMLSTVDRMDAGITQHSSMNESGYFTGGAATIRLGDWQVSAFGSYRKADGTYNRDSTGMSSLKTDGLHRTQLEWSKRGNVGVSNFGGNVHWEYKRLRLSVTTMWTHLDVPLMPKYDTKASAYRVYNASGRRFMVGGMAYAYGYRTLTFSGETAFSNTEKQNGMATLNTLRWRVNSDNVLTVIGRYYGAKFVSLYGKAFGENSMVQNEEGVFVGWTSKSVKNLELEAYVDAMYFPWLKQGISASSYGWEGMLQTLYSRGRKWSLLARYRLKSKQKDFTVDRGKKSFKVLEYDSHHTVKLQLNYTLSPCLNLRTSATGSYISFGTGPAERGFAVGEDIRWKSSKSKMRFDVSVTYFDTDSYNARVYFSEPSLPYTFSSSAYSDHGIRTILLASVPIARTSLFINGKFTMTKYFGRDSIGSGLETIHANHKEDLLIQIRWII